MIIIYEKSSGDVMLISEHKRETAPCLHHLLAYLATTALLFTTYRTPFISLFRNKLKVKFTLKSMLETLCAVHKHFGLHQHGPKLSLVAQRAQAAA